MYAFRLKIPVLDAIKTKAAAGVPYQSYVSAILEEVAKMQHSSYFKACFNDVGNK